MPDPIGLGPRGAIREDAPAKVNLFLHVTGRRADGYHLLDSLVVFAAVHDSVSAVPARDLTLTLSGPFGQMLANDEDNLVVRAARALAGEAGIAPGAHLLLNKVLPVASGIGGGSADAAATLRALCRLWDIEPGTAKLHQLAARLGADVPVCLDSLPTRMSGIGEVLQPVSPVPSCGLVLLNPGVGVSTPAVFRARTGTFSLPAEIPKSWQDSRELAHWLSGTRNDLEAPARELRPVIGDVLAALAGDRNCMLARMSGSGATCFGLFADARTANRAAARLARPGWWAWGGGLRTA